MSEPIGWNVYHLTRGIAGEEYSTFREFIPNERAGDGPPYVHRLGATHGPAFTVRDLLPSWEPPLSQFGTPVAPVRPFPVKAEPREVPEAFRRR